MTPMTAAARPNGAPRARRMTTANVRRGKVETPWWILLYAEPKVGKTTFAAGAPDPVFIELDNGTKELDVARYPKVTSFADVLEALEDAAVTAETSKREGRPLTFKTLVIDPLSQLEPHIHNDVTGGAIVNTKKWGGGFGAYENALRDRARVFFKAVERCWEAGMNIMLVGHARLKKREEADSPAYERWDLEGEIREMSGLAYKYAQAIFFARRETFGKVDPDTKKAKAAGAGIHMLYTVGTASFVAGNRWGLPPSMPLSWAAFAHAKANHEEQLAKTLAEIQAGLEAINDPTVTAKVNGYLADKHNPAQVLNAVRAKLAELAAAAEETAPEETKTDETTNTNEEES